MFNVEELATLRKALALYKLNLGSAFAKPDDKVIDNDLDLAALEHKVNELEPNKIKFELVDEEASALRSERSTLQGSIIVPDGIGVGLQFDGYTDNSSQDDKGTPVFIEYYAGKLLIRAYADVNRDEPTSMSQLNRVKTIIALTPDYLTGKSWYHPSCITYELTSTHKLNLGDSIANQVSRWHLMHTRSSFDIGVKAGIIARMSDPMQFDRSDYKGMEKRMAELRQPGAVLLMSKTYYQREHVEALLKNMKYPQWLVEELTQWHLKHVLSAYVRGFFNGYKHYISLQRRSEGSEFEY